MFGIKDIAHYIPEDVDSNLESGRLEKFGVSEQFVKDKIGVHQRPRLGENHDTSDIALLALNNLLKKSDIKAEDIDVLVVVTQNPDTNLPHVSALVHGRAGLRDDCAAFDVGLGCSGYVYGLSIINSFMSSNSMRMGVLVTADPYSKIVDPEDKNTSLLFGDAATATLISDNPLFSIGPFTFGTSGSMSQALTCSGQRLSMNGREVFNFTALGVPKDIESLLHKAEIDKEKIDLFVLHQGSRYIVETIRKRLHVPAECVPVELADTGNTVSSSIPLVLEKRLNDDGLKTILLSGFGVGLSWASCICNRER
jgi:3-oxoacyl-[acyl-carrier-protein] synthase-3